MNRFNLYPILFVMIFIFFGCNKLKDTPPNIVFILTDDLAYADLSSYGSEFIDTPNLDKMADDGLKMTSYYAPQAVCSASRAAILTGCYPNRLGISGAFGPKSKRGINPDELLLSEMLQSNNYKTGIFGKWHLGDAEKFMPTNHGFDEFYGILFSNDMWPFHPERPQDYPNDLMLYRNDKPVQALIDQSDLTKNITDESIRFIEENKNNQFFLYIAHPQPHVPLFASKEFQGSTGEGLFADVISEIDFSVGRVIEALEKNNLSENTIVVFTANHGDNLGEHGRFYEGNMLEASVGVPLIIQFPEMNLTERRIIEENVSHVDLVTTLLKAAGIVPSNSMPGKDLRPLIEEKEDWTNHAVYAEFYKYHETPSQLMMRKGDYKLTYSVETKDDMFDIRLYNLKQDPWEQQDLSNSGDHGGLYIDMSDALMNDYWKKIWITLPREGLN